MSDIPPPVTRELAEFVAGTTIKDIPADVIARGHIHLLDVLGLALAGNRSKVFDRILTYIAAQASSGRASILATAGSAPPSLAALANGTAMHADNFDDTNPQPTPDRNGGIHAGAVVIPAALAAAEATNASGTTLSTAIHCGLEVACKLNHALDARHYQGGYHATASLGIFGAAAAAASIFELDAEKTADALAIATARAGGIRGNFGTMTEQAHCGIAAESGLAAAEMARAGISGAGDILERANGWFAAAGGGFIRDAICGKLGHPWALVDPGTSIKPWPNGALTHPAMTLMSRLIAEHDLTPDKVAFLSVRTNERVRATLIHDRPQDAGEARFSMPFALAALLVEGQAGLGTFTDETVAKPEIRAAMEKIEFSSYAEAGPGYTNVTSLIDIRLCSGETIDGRADYAVGSSQAPMGWDAVSEKYRQCADYAGWPAEKAEEAADAVLEIEAAPDMRRLIAALTR